MQAAKVPALSGKCKLYVAFRGWNVTFVLFCPKRPTGTLDISRASGYYADKASSFKFGGNGQRNVFFFYPRVIRASCHYYCKFSGDHRRPEAYQSLREKGVSLCFRS